MQPTRRQRALRLMVLVATIGAASFQFAHASAATPKITDIVPHVAFLETDGTYTFKVIGTDLGERPILIFPGTKAFPLCPEDAGQPPPEGCVNVKVIDGVASFSKIGSDNHGLHKPVGVLVGGQKATFDKGVALSLVSEQGAVAISLLIILAIIFGLLMLVRSGKPKNLANGKMVSFGKALFIDPATSTYSLSKLQFYLWSFAIVGGYVYLTVAQSLVQGSFALADAPIGIAKILLTSVGATVAAVGVSSFAGNKGSGEFEPSLSDLLTSGGVIAPERVQFLLWSVIGALSFLAFTFFVGPADITALPSVPDGFWQISGISAAGYVAGKIARGPGPQIASATAKLDTGQKRLVLEIAGSNLATKGATFLIAKETSGAFGSDEAVAATVESGTVADASGIATKLVLSVTAPPTWPTLAVGDKLKFTIMNPDGEKAVWQVATAA